MRKKRNEIMNIYQTVLKQLIEEKKIVKLYHFEGRFTKYPIAFENEFSFQIPKNSYIYFSKSLRHHEYYANKNILCDLNQMAQENFGKPFYHLDLADKQIYHKVRCFIEQHYQNFSYKSYEINVLSTYQHLLETYAVYNLEKTKMDSQRQIPEICDTRKHSGGYGIKGRWSKLLEDSTIYAHCFEMDYRNVLKIIEIIREKDRPVYPTTPILEYPRYISGLSENLYLNPFHKFVLFDDLIEINKKVSLNENLEYYLQSYKLVKDEIHVLLKDMEKKLK